ncbi:response regulator [Ramlibacter sp. AW1]|uniref:histidine kinase n=1 Tax=Ramlibacter aurantiacus TaxID=2801330 RepID=A0A936ZEX2_9BURK|nr:response regulator [Ramlibacter aurantiacus]MBL0419667.1 response regulator [Ramlibacter aurantiacus]
MERRILVYSRPGRDVILVEKVLRAGGLDPLHCDTPIRLAEQLRLGVGALMLGEETLNGVTVAALSDYLQEQPAWSDLPILLLAKHGADSLEAQRGIEKLGNVTLLERPVRTMALISAARSALRARDRQYEMRALNQRKDEFLAALAHELRNPLAPISHAMALLQRQHPSAQTDKLTGIVERQVSHLKRLVDDLLDIARVTNGKLELQRSMTRADKVVQHAVEIAQAGITAQSHRLSIEVPSEPVDLYADHVRLVQCVANLLVNAAKFTPPRGEITLSVKVAPPVVQFAVRDNGKGLDAEFLGRIFSMFSQSRTVGEPTTGLGLGLHLTRAFAQLHGGSVTAHSDGPGCGSEFVLSVPAVVEAAGAQVAVASPGANPLQRSILVVDDNVDAASTLGALLTLQGASVEVAHDGAQALAAVKHKQPEAVVMDIGMPVMNGYEAARAIRALVPKGALTLIALSGWGQYADKARALEAGFDYHFVKPLDIDDLIGCLQSTAPVGAGAEAAGRFASQGL